jgi:hypothetical protein
MALKHNLSNIFAMLDDIEKNATKGIKGEIECDLFVIRELAANTRKHLNTVLKQCAVAGRCPAIKDVRSDEQKE